MCNYCGGVFCADHRLPEAHQCKGDLTRRRTIIAPPQSTYTMSSSDLGGTFMGPPEPRQQNIFSAVEIRDIAIALLGLALAFSIELRDAVTVGPVLTFILALVTVGSGFVLHELSHKFTAQKYGYWAEFRMWPLGLVLALVTSLIGFIFAAPGATYISGMNISVEQNGRISLAGPLTNVAVSLVFLPMLLFGVGYIGLLGYFGVQINVFLALFNLIPIMPLDGAKVFRWSKARWAPLFAGLAVAYIAFLIFVV